MAHMDLDDVAHTMPLRYWLHTYPSKPRVFILSDILNEPDDSESLVRLLLYTDQLDIRGLVATTSTWLRNATHPEEMHKIVSAYGKVQAKLNKHVHPDYPFPPVEDLLDKISSGPAVYGWPALSEPLSPGAELLIQRLNESTSPLYLSAWGGVNTLAQALQHMSNTLSPEESAALRKRLRVYTISDQDNTADWIRGTYPDIRYTASIHAMNMYTTGTWTGISFDYGTAVDFSIVSNPWLAENIQLGELGAMYPELAFLMEGDTPSFLYLLQNGLGDREHMDWGSWGGRYGLVNLDVDNQHYVDTIDRVIGADGKLYNTPSASIWRWRTAFQNDFASRMQWTLHDDFSAASHPPVVYINGSSGPDTRIFDEVTPNSTFVLDASETFDPDHPGDTSYLDFEWYQYWDPSATSTSDIPVYGSGGLLIEGLSGVNGSATTMPFNDSGFQNVTAGATVVRVTVTSPPSEFQSLLHLVLAVTSCVAKYPVTRYRRVVFNLVK
ncbi:uncharacterized protein BCR38DRAFT_463166 [Pseudomassariella vexata]|uniref:DUF1593-domain-containing protein n=1 Tax=Pseudomassariella vexata TaxID=1141098 RepID=A0A1Y2EDI7_9PEZI|nr:uncharacterized protein BCR38DRAFT_463166 [Pseudomassariella vexata]ORY69631.1 hypothetical protein BCR38DRAFT_463166 [Pseudomassariella vexata]